MLRRRIPMTLFVAWIALGWPVAGAEPSGGTVLGTGEVAVKVQPTVLRMEMTLLYHDKTLEGALKKSKEGRAAVTAKLLELKAEKDSIRCGTPLAITVGAATPSYGYRTFVPPPTASYRPAAGPALTPIAPPPTYSPAPAPLAPAGAAEDAGRYGVPAPAVPPATVPPPVTEPAPEGATLPRPAISPTLQSAPSATPALPPPPAPTWSAPGAATSAPGWDSYIVSMTIAADWPLAGDSPEALLTAAEKLQGKIVAADLAGIKPAGKRGGDNEPEEAPARTFDPYTPRAYATPAPYGSAGPAYYVPAGTTAPGMPRFVYAARLTDAQRKAALAEACAKAKTQAKELAEAAGVKLGGIASLSHNITVMSGAGGFDPNVCYPPAPGHAFGLSDDEGLNHTPGEIEFRIQVRGQFQLQ